MKIIHIFFIAYFILLSGCMTYPDNPPPKYKILHNENGEYVVELPNGFRMYKWIHKNQPYSSRKTAIKAAWEQYNYIPCKPDTTTWLEAIEQNNKEIDNAGK